MTLAEQIARELGTLSHIKCAHCGRDAYVDTATSLRRGWPECCGETMRLLPVSREG